MKKMTKFMFIFALFLIPIASWLDVLMFKGVCENITWKNYFFVNIWEYCLMWVGFYYGKKYKKNHE